MSLEDCLHVTSRKLDTLDTFNSSDELFLWVTWCGRRLLDGHAGSAIKVLVAIHYSVLDARNGYIRNVVV